MTPEENKNFEAEFTQRLTAMGVSPNFIGGLRKRWEIGKETYGQGVHDRPISSLLGEAIEECLDQAGWAYLSWVNLKRVQTKVRALEEEGKI